MHASSEGLNIGRSVYTQYKLKLSGSISITFGTVEFTVLQEGEGDRVCSSGVGLAATSFEIV